MPKTTGNYETVVIFNTKVGEEGIAALTEKFKTLISDNGTINNIEEWGKRRLAYPHRGRGPKAIMCSSISPAVSLSLQSSTVFTKLPTVFFAP